MKATDIARQIARREIVPPLAVTPLVLAALWQERVAALFPGVSVTLGSKERGQLSVFIRKVGEDRALSAVAFALANWPVFRRTVNQELTGLDVAPKTPSVGTVLKHRQILLDMMGAG